MKSQRILYLEQLRAIASVLVVVIHVSSQHWKVVDVYSLDWQVMNIYDSFARVAVPLFVMISGAIFLNPKREVKIKDLYTKYVKHIALVLVIWSLFYALFYYFRNGETFEKMMTRFIGGHFHLWYLFMLIGLYMITPILRKIAESKTLTEYFLLLSLVLTSFLPTLIKFPMFKWMSDPFSSLHYHFTLGYSSYYLCGHYLHEYELSKNKQRLLYFLGIVGVLFTIGSSTYMSYLNGVAYKGFYNNFCIGVVLEAVAMFTYLKYHPLKIQRLPLFMAKYSFGVYLVHILVLNELKTMGIHTLMCSSIFSIPLLIVLVYGLSLSISFCLKHLKGISKYLF